MRTSLAVTLGLALSMLAGCGVKNLPVAPATNAAPNVSAAQQVAPSTGEAIVSRSGGVARGATITAGDADKGVTAAEVSRNPGSNNRGFFLDPLLN